MSQRRVPVLFGVDALDEMAERIDGKRVYLCCDPGVRASGAVDPVEETLRRHGVEVRCFDRVVSNPTETVLEDAAAELRTWQPDVILGVGGGAAMDTAKVAGLLLDSGISLKELLERGGVAPRTPVFVIPTSAGTGAESAWECVVYGEESSRTVERLADLAVLDPRLTMTCPADVTAQAGLGALSHAVEAYTSAGPDRSDEELALRAIRLIGEHLPACLREPRNLEARSELLYASHIAGAAALSMGLHIGHCFAYEAGARLGLNHSLLSALALPEVLSAVVYAKPKEVFDAARALGMDLPGCASESELGQIASIGMRSFLRRCGLPSMKQLGVSREAVVSLAADALENQSHYAERFPGELTAERMEQFCAAVYDNYQDRPRPRRAQRGKPLY